MAKIFHPLLALIASAADRELAKYIQFLKEENKILRARVPGQIHTRSAERERLLKFGKALGRAVEQLITIVTPGTFYRWINEDDGKSKAKNPKGGQRKAKEIREFVIQVAKTTGFGYTRIIGELRKIGIKKISRQTVRNILKEEGIEPGPERKSDCWNEFLKQHADTLWACDFFAVKTVTAWGIREMYVLVFLCLETREAILSPATEHPNSAWVVEQADLFVAQTSGRERKLAIVMHDRDTKFTKEFVAKLKQRGLQTNLLPKASPNLNGRCERFIQTIKLECLAKFIIFGKKHLDYLLTEFAEYYNTVRSHMERDHVPPLRDVPEEIQTLNRDQIEIRSYVGGLVKAFQRKAA